MSERIVSVEDRAEIVRGFFGSVPHNDALGIELVHLSDSVAIMSLPYAPHVVGNPETGVHHGGAITSLMDACCGAGVFMALENPKPIATLDLRIDYLRLGQAEKPVHCRAECYRVTRNVAFVRATAYHPDSPELLIASAAGSFMVGTKSGQRPSPVPSGENPF